MSTVSRATPATDRAPARSRALRPRFFGTVRGEILKVRRQRATWVMLCIGVLLFLIVVGALASAPELKQQVQHDPRGFFYLLLNVFLSVFDAGAGIFLLLLAARLVAMEYSSGTIRILLARGTGRIMLLMAKLVTLAGVGVAVFIAYIAATAVAIYILVTATTGSFQAITSLPQAAWSNLWINILIGLISVGINILLATAAAVLGRSLAFGLGAALAFFPADNFGTIVFMLLNRLTHQQFFADITAYMLGPNLNVLQTVLQSDHKANAAFAQPLVPVSATHAVLVIAAWALAFLLVSVVLTWRRDVLE